MMANISERERILLGCSPNALLNFPSNRRSSEVDFSDVFGGPPRRSSVQEFCDEGVEFDDVESDGFRRSWFGLGEKPVFGDKMGVRRRYPNQDFFDDIFRGDQSLSCSQSPRIMPSRDPFSSAPVSRVMSPARSLPASAEPIGNPSKLSLPARLSNRDFLASTSVNQGSKSPSPPFNRFLSQTIQNHDAVSGDARSSYRPSPLSHQGSLDCKDPTSGRKLDGSVGEPGFIKDSKGSEVPYDSTQFHFSIYKWASKGVPLVMSFRRRSPTRAKEGIKMEKHLNSTENSTEGVGNDIHEVDTPVNASLSFNRSEKQSATSGVRDSEHCHGNIENKVPEDGISHGLEDPIEVPTLSGKGLGAEVDNSSSKSPANIRKFYLRPLGSLLQEEKKENETVIAKKDRKESTVKEKEKPYLDNAISSGKVNKSKVHQSFREAKDDLRKGDVTGKVKDFIKIFNQESSSKAAANVLGQSQSCRWKDTATFKAENEVKSISTNKHDKMQASDVNWGKTCTETSEVVIDHSFLSGDQQFKINDIGSVFDSTSKQKDSRASANEPIADTLKASAPSINAASNTDILSRGSPQGFNIQLEVEYQEDIQGYETKALQWSKGKEGNIRALLSTLQYVLWPNSGWKPVPLMDIIEANAVRRAYQKALLCLHPDKLQQKGAAPHQKFIAEKVFDVLQVWVETIGSFQFGRYRFKSCYVGQISDEVNDWVVGFFRFWVNWGLPFI